MIDVFELAIYLTSDEDDWETTICDKYGIDYEDFQVLVNELLPLIEVGESPLTGKQYKGFADVSHAQWLVKTEIKPQ